MLYCFATLQCIAHLADLSTSCHTASEPKQLLSRCISRVKGQHPDFVLCCCHSVTTFTSTQVAVLAPIPCSHTPLLQPHLLKTHMLQVLRRFWQALVAKTWSLYKRTTYFLCLVIDPSLGGPYWVHYPEGAGEWAITSYMVSIMLYTMVSSPTHHISLLVPCHVSHMILMYSVGADCMRGA